MRNKIVFSAVLIFCGFAFAERNEIFENERFILFRDSIFVKEENISFAMEYDEYDEKRLQEFIDCLNDIDCSAKWVKANKAYAELEARIEREKAERAAKRGN